MRIGLYTTHAVHNVGAMLQAFALATVLKREGCDVEIINVLTKELDSKNHHRGKTSLCRRILRELYIFAHPGIRGMEQNFEDFHKKLPLTKRYYSNKEYIELPNQYDIHLVGSDQVWNTQKGYKHSELCYLNYLPKEAVKKSYASSFGTTDIVKDEENIKEALLSFTSLSVREDKAVEFVKGLTGEKCVQNLDPTFLLTSEEWDQYVEEEPIVKEKYIFYYGVNEDKPTWNILCEAKRRLNAKLVGYPGPLPPKYHFDKYIYNGGPLQFINLIRNAEMVITSSFHGLAFAINYHKKFMLVKYGERMERMESLLRLLNANEFFACTQEDVIRIIDLNNPSRLARIQEKLNVERKKSMGWIIDNIISPLF